jgi:hypothetical protein
MVAKGRLWWWTFEHLNAPRFAELIAHTVRTSHHKRVKSRDRLWMTSLIDFQELQGDHLSASSILTLNALILSRRCRLENYSETK